MNEERRYTPNLRKHVHTTTIIIHPEIKTAVQFLEKLLPQTLSTTPKTKF